MSAGTCRSCHARILWAWTSSGKRMPVDIEPVEGGNVLVVPSNGDKLEAHVFTADGRRAWTSHFATCPNAVLHRGKATP